MHSSSFSALSSRPRHSRLSWQSAGVLLVALVALCSCGGPPQNLPFTTITSTNDFTPLGVYGEKAPAILVIASPHDLINPGLGVHFTSGLGDPLRALDYRDAFAILVLQGLKGSGGYQVIVQQVTRRNNQITVLAEFKQPVPGEGRTLGYTSPYQLIAVSKDAQWEPVTQVELVVSGETVTKATVNIP